MYISSRSSDDYIKNQLKRTLLVTEKLIRDHISGIPVINSQELMWQRTTLLKAVQCDRETYVFSDSVFCMERISPDPVKAWKEKIDVIGL